MDIERQAGRPLYGPSNNGVDDEEAAGGWI